jgi:leucyl-tRNA synthetase
MTPAQVAVDAYVFVTCPTVGGDLDGTRLRGYAIADAHARYRRARGEDVLLTLGFDTFATTPKPADGQAVDEWVAERCAALRAQLDGLGASFDWDRALLTSDPAVYRWSQWLFVKLLEAGLAYQRGGKGWYMSTGRFNEENDRRLDELEGWSDAARAAQRALLKRVDGFELEATALDGTALTLFVAHPDAVSSAEFVGLSPQRPELDGWLGDAELSGRIDELRRGDWADTPAAELPVVEVGMSAQVPGVPQPLPILVSPAIDARFGPAAILGIPSADDADKALAKGLPKAGGLAWKVEAKGSKPAPAVRFFAEDMPLSRGRAWGAPVPAVHCDACGVVPVPLDRLPLEPPPDLDVAARGNALAERPDFVDCECPSCGAAAKRDLGTLHPRLGAAWIELALAVPPADRAESMFDHPELGRWLPTAQTVEDADSAPALLAMRTVAKALRDAGGVEALDGEPLGPTLVHARLELDLGDARRSADGERQADDGTPDGAAADGDATDVDAPDVDALRFAILHAAAPAKAFAGGEPAVRHAAAFLDRLRAFAEPRLEAAAGTAAGGGPGGRIDGGDGLRRRLASWCDTAVSRTAENYERLDMHRATRNAIELLARIEDFERRVTEYRGEVAGADRDAVAVALATLVRIVAPLAPRLADDLWRRAGGEGQVADADWPTPQREPAAA